MKLSDLSIRLLNDYVIGEKVLPRRTGSEIIDLYNLVGVRDVYKSSEGGLPEGLSRKVYSLKILNHLNGTKELKHLLEIIVDSRFLSGFDNGKIKEAVDELNSIIKNDYFRYEEVNGQYKIIGDDGEDPIQVEVHFKEIQTQIIEQLSNAKFLIWVAVAWFTDIELLRYLYKKKKQGLNIRIIILDDKINEVLKKELNKHFEYYELKPEGKYQNIMHHKFCVIDLKTVIHGSYNWTLKAQYNKETISIENSKEIAEKYAAEFINLASSYNL